MCEYNKSVAEKHGNSDTVQCWKLAKLIATSLTAATDSLDDEIFSQQIPFPKILLESLWVKPILIWNYFKTRCFVALERHSFRTSLREVLGYFNGNIQLNLDQFIWFWPWFIDKICFLIIPSFIQSPLFWIKNGKFLISFSIFHRIGHFAQKCDIQTAAMLSCAFGRHCPSNTELSRSSSLSGKSMNGSVSPIKFTQLLNSQHFNAPTIWFCR